MRNTLSLLFAAVFSATCLTASAQIKAYDYDTPSYVQFSDARYEVLEGETNAVVTLIRSGDYRKFAAVEYTTREGTAEDSFDFQASGGKVVFSAGQSIRTITIPILRTPEAISRMFQVELTEADVNTVVVTPSAEVEIKAQPPSLTIVAKGGALELSWRAAPQSFALEAQANGEWSAISGAELLDGNWRLAFVPNAPIALFRLRSQTQANQ